MKATLGFIFTFFFTFLLAFQAFAGFGAYQDTTNLGIYGYVKCSSGLLCTKSGDKLKMVANPTLTGGIAGVTGFTNFYGFAPQNITSGTSPSMTIATGVSGTLYLHQLFVPVNATLTGIAIANGNVVGTNSWILALYNSLGVLVANTTLSGVTTTTSGTYQKIPFVASGSVVGPGVYWIGANISGATDTFVTAGANAQQEGLAGSVTGIIYGTLSGTITLPTTFTAGKGPAAYTY